MPQRSTYESTTQRQDGTNVANPATTKAVDPSSNNRPSFSNEQQQQQSSKPHQQQQSHVAGEQDKLEQEERRGDRGEVKRAGGGGADFATTEAASQGDQRGKPGVPFGSPEKGGKDMNLVEPGPAMAGDGTAEGGVRFSSPISKTRPDVGTSIDHFCVGHTVGR